MTSDAGYATNSLENYETDFTLIRKFISVIITE